MGAMVIHMPESVQGTADEAATLAQQQVPHLSDQASLRDHIVIQKEAVCRRCLCQQECALFCHSPTRPVAMEVDDMTPIAQVAEYPMQCRHIEFIFIAGLVGDHDTQARLLIGQGSQRDGERGGAVAGGDQHIDPVIHRLGRAARD